MLMFVRWLSLLVTSWDLVRAVLFNITLTTNYSVLQISNKVLSPCFLKVNVDN